MGNLARLLKNPSTLDETLEALVTAILLDEEIGPQAGVSLVVTASNLSGIAFPNGAFSLIPLPNVIEDTASAWDPATNLYTVPIAGTYLIITKLRLADGTLPGVSYGLGVNDTAVDGPWFEWFVTQAAAESGAARQGALNTRILSLAAGQTIEMYGYLDYSTSLPYIEAAMDLSLLSVP